jgi:hypothetical protein
MGQASHGSASPTRTTSRALMAQAVLVRQSDQLGATDDSGEPAEGERENARRSARRAGQGSSPADGVQRGGNDADGRSGALGGDLIVLEVIKAGRTLTIHGK